jgi:putative nucleotidyltransferase with HDIG domain
MTERRSEEEVLDGFTVVQQEVTHVMNTLSRSQDARSSALSLDLSHALRRLDRLEQDARNYFRFRREQVQAVAGVGSVINSSLGLGRVLEEVMDALIVLMRAERGFLMLKERDGNLEVRIARDAAHHDLTEDAFIISRSVVGRVVEQGEAVLTLNAQEDPRFGAQTSITAHHLLSILCAPLKLKEELIGVIYVDNRAQAGIFKNDDLELIASFSNQAAVAIDNARLIDELQDKNRELEEAYQATLEGWVLALDLRDKETEGHTIRVTRLTETLAKSMGIREAELIHIRRGALLHDIGKMAIPDGILLKPGALTAEERTLIEKHPVYAFEMLSPIKFLNPALDIPYCHHEKWDGSGYPRGLSGEDIPLAARIFSVVDVWDALVSDRPYRKGLQPDDVKGKIRDDAGAHFDPRVVDAFLALGEHPVR